jgi:hypothetical protein
MFLSSGFLAYVILGCFLEPFPVCVLIIDIGDYPNAAERNSELLSAQHNAADTHHPHLYLGQDNNWTLWWD